jgi:hypothetical protein
MTREEAIDCIKAIHVQMFNSGASKWTEACDMAIEALKDRPHGEWKNGMCTNCGAECFEDYYMRDINTEFCHRCGADMRPKEGEAE